MELVKKQIHNSSERRKGEEKIFKQILTRDYCVFKGKMSLSMTAAI